MPIVLGLLGLQLWLARSRGEIWTHGGAVRRADRPLLFRVGFALYGLVFALFVVLVVLETWRAFAPPPLSERMTRLYPSAAAARKVEGHVILTCRVTPEYGVKDCRVASETPPAYGFGAAAIQAATLTTLSQADRARAIPGQFINLPIRFKLPTDKR